MKKVLFRFLFIYFLLASPLWYWFYDVPGFSYLIGWYIKADEWTAGIFNRYLFHIAEKLNLEANGSGDTSYGWAQFYTCLLLAATGCLVWTLLDAKRQSYARLDLWLRNLVRYFVAIVAFRYGIGKLFALQMPFPNLSYLATPLGDFLPMRLSWMFIGYSTPYQVFSGIAEVIVGILLLNRRTVLLGSLAGLAVFANVFMLNLSYDIPVKIFSMQLVICCLFLTASDGQRLWNFFLLNKPVQPGTGYNLDLTERWQKVLRIIWKAGFIITAVVLPFKEYWDRYHDESNLAELKPIRSGIYEIHRFLRNNDTIPLPMQGDKAWKDFIFDKGGSGSIHTSDTLFAQRYRRGYFRYQPDSVKEVITFRKRSTDSTSLFQMRYRIVDDKNLVLWGKVGEDSLYFELLRSDRHFQLAEKPFHWLTETIK